MAAAALTVGSSATAATGPSVALGDGKTTTASAKAGWIYACKIMTGGGGASGATPWISGNLWYPDLKPSVQGAVKWTQASISVGSLTSKRVIKTTGLPTNATTGTFPIATTDPAYQYDKNPNSIKAGNYSVSVPLNPKIAAKPTCLSLGPIGYSLNGVAIFNGLDGENRDAVAHEIQDVCGGHPERTGQYHYHFGSKCITKKSTSQATLIGYALDGFGIYFEQDSSGKSLTNAALDECHGRVSKVMFNGKLQSIYHYVATQEYPYTLGCYKGTPTLTASTTTGQSGTGTNPQPRPTSSSAPTQPGTGTPPPPPPSGSMDGAGSPAGSLAVSLIGLTEADAMTKVRAAGLTARIVARDGQSFAVTMDFRPDRINLTIMGGKVSKATLG